MLPTSSPVIRYKLSVNSAHGFTFSELSCLTASTSPPMAFCTKPAVSATFTSIFLKLAKPTAKIPNTLTCLDRLTVISHNNEDFLPMLPKPAFIRCKLFAFKTLLILCIRTVSITIPSRPEMLMATRKAFSCINSLFICC